MAEERRQVELSEDERTVARFAEELFVAAKKAKDPVTEKVRRFEKLWRGEHWPQHRPKHKTAAVSNFIFSLIETEVTWLSENRPTMVVEPMGPEDTRAAKIVERIITDYLWPELEIRSKIKRMTRSGLKAGKGFLKVTWDQLTHPQMGGEVAVDYVPWDEIFLDPQANSVRDARYIIHARVLPLSEIVKRWPENGWKVEADPKYSLGTDEREVYVADVDRPIIAGSQQPITDTRHRALVLECWIRDDSYELRQEMDADGNIVRETQEYLYPGGRLLIVANGVPLTDTNNPYQDGEFPFVDFSGYETEDSPWDMGEIEQLEPIQRALNMLESKFIDNARLMTNTVWKKSADAGIKASDVTNEEGLVLTVQNSRAILERVPPTPLPQHYFSLYQQLQRNMEVITGIYEVTQGRRPQGVTAASAISLLQEAGQARIRDKARNLEDSIRHLGRLLISRITQFYDAQRVVRLRGEGNQLQFEQFDPASVRVGLDFYVEAGSSIQMNEQQRYQMALELFQFGGIDVEGLLEASNFPNRDQIIQRMQQQRALMARQQQQQGVAGAPIAGGGTTPTPLPPGAAPPTAVPQG